MLFGSELPQKKQTRLIFYCNEGDSGLAFEMCRTAIKKRKTSPSSCEFFSHAGSPQAKVKESSAGDVYLS